MNTNLPLVRDIFWIDRPALVSQFERLLQSGKRLFLIDTVATYGSGKTTLLSQLYEKMKLQEEMQPLWLSLDRIRLSQPEEDEESHVAREDDYEVFHSALRDVLEGLVQSLKLNARVAREFIERMGKLETETVLAALRQTPSLRIEKASNVSTGSVHIESGAIIRSKVTTGDIIVDTEGVYDTVLAEATEVLRKRVADEFLVLAKEITKGKRYGLLIDGFCSIIGMRVAGWFLELLKQLDNVTVVVARTVTPHDLPSSHLVTQLPLPAFDRADIGQYLRNRFGPIPGLDRLAEPIHGFSHGHPGTVSLAADSIVADELADIDGLCAFFDRISHELLPENPHTTDLEQRYDLLIDEVLCDIGEKDPELRDALHVATALRYFTRDTMEGVLGQLDGADGSPAQERSALYYSALVKRLSRYSFVEQLSGKKNESPTYALHNFLRSRMELRLRTDDPSLHARIHEEACKYYRDKIDTFTEDQSKKVYVGNYRLENKDWQEYTTEWLYHLSAWQKRAPAEARLHFAGVYFETFNWWNWLLPFDYSAQLLRLWQEVRQGEKDQELLELLNELDASYPKGYDKHNLGDWKSARSALVNLKRLLGLRGKLDDLNSEARTILGFIEWFIAQSYRFGSPQDFKSSEEHFLASRAVFEANDDLWNLIWTDGYLADLYMEMGERDQAIERAKSSLQSATSGELECFDEQDHEVISQSYRVLGDVYWSTGELGSAFRDYTRAAFHACVFNVIPVAPDEYTTTLYASVCRHIAGRVVELLEAGRELVARKAAEYGLDFWKPYWESSETAREKDALPLLLDKRDAEALVVYLFPPAPTNKKEIRELVTLFEEMCDDVENLEPAPIA